MADTETETTAKQHNTTAYIVLQKVGEDWTILRGHVSGVEAPSAEAAIRFAIGRVDVGAEEGTYVAVPHRSWKPVTVTARQTTTLDLKPAT